MLRRAFMWSRSWAKAKAKTVGGTEHGAYRAADGGSVAAGLFVGRYSRETGPPMTSLAGFSRSLPPSFEYSSQQTGWKQSKGMGGCEAGRGEGKTR